MTVQIVPVTILPGSVHGAPLGVLVGIEDTTLRPLMFCDLHGEGLWFHPLFLVITQAAKRLVCTFHLDAAVSA